MSLWANRALFPYNLSSFVDFYILKSTDNRNTFLDYYLEVFRFPWIHLPKCWRLQSGHKQGIKLLSFMRGRKRYYHIASVDIVCSCVLISKLKIKDTDHPYSEDVSWVMVLVSWLLGNSGTLPFLLLLRDSSKSKHLISSGQVAFEFYVVLLFFLFLPNPWCYNIEHSVVWVVIAVGFWCFS